MTIALVLTSLMVWPAPERRTLAQCQQWKLTAVDAAAGDSFSHSVAIDGALAAIGNPGDDLQATNSGTVNTFQFEGTEWSPGEVISRPGGHAYDVFGWSVALDGPWLVACVYGEVEADVFQENVEAGWVRTSVLSPWDGHTDNLFAQCAAIDSNTIVVGAPLDTNENGGRAGAAYVFERDPNGVWLEKQKLIASDGQPADAFGQTVSVDGDVIVVGAPSDDDFGFATGSAYIFERDPNSAVWVEVQKLHPIVHTGMDIFGDAVAVSGDAMLVGASQTDYAGVWTGVAYVFRRAAPRDGSVYWELEQALTPTEPLDGEAFGQSVSLDGDRALVGAWYSDQHGPLSGAAYAFERDPNSGVWSQTAKLVPLDGQAYDEFGYSVGLSGTTAVVGAWKDDDMGTDSGSAYIFDLAGGDCNANGWCDDVDIANGTSQDANANGVPDECDCWGDLDGSGLVDLADLSALLTNFGLPSGMQYSDGDIDGDYDVDLADLSALLERYGVECPQHRDREIEGSREWGASASHRQDRSRDRSPQARPVRRPVPQEPGGASASRRRRQRQQL